VRNDDYWRTKPAWEEGPSGLARPERVVIKKVEEWGTRYAMLQAGDTDLADVNADVAGQVDPLVVNGAGTTQQRVTSGPAR